METQKENVENNKVEMAGKNEIKFSFYRYEVIVTDSKIITTSKTPLDSIAFQSVINNLPFKITYIHIYRNKIDRTIFYTFIKKKEVD